MNYVTLRRKSEFFGSIYIKPKHSYIDLMRKFTRDHEEKCNAISIDTRKVSRPNKRMVSGAQYEGRWDNLGMAGMGKYTLPNGVIYEGEFEDGLFHGMGDLIYPDGTTLIGRFRRGRVIEHMLKFHDDLFYSERDWAYCDMPDRKFIIEYEFDIQPGGNSFMSATDPTREIPKGYYDTGDGFYDPKTRTVFNENLTTIIRSLSDREHKWTIENCRVSDLEPGPRPHLYEQWVELNVPEETIGPEMLSTPRTRQSCVDDLSDLGWLGYLSARRSSAMWFAGAAFSSHMFFTTDDD